MTTDINTTDQQPMCSACGALLPTPIQAAEFKIVTSSELAHLLGSMMCHAGWRVLGTFSEPAPRHTQQPMGIWSDEWVQEPRIILGRGGRDELIAKFQEGLRTMTTERDTLVKERDLERRRVEALTGRLDSAAALVKARGEDADGLRKDIEQLRADHAAQDEAHRRLEDDLAKVRVAIGELAFKKILDGSK